MLDMLLGLGLGLMLIISGVCMGGLLVIRSLSNPKGILNHWLEQEIQKLSHQEDLQNAAKWVLLDTYVKRALVHQRVPVDHPEVAKHIKEKFHMN